MPSNQCTNSLMELSFAIGNMIGAENCDIEDWRQLNSALLAWECSTRGDAGDAVDGMKGTVRNAISHCGAEDGCLATDCTDLFENHEVLVQSLNIYEPAQLSQGLRGPIPPKIKGAEGLARSLGLAGQRDAELKRIAERIAAEERRKRTETETQLAERKRLEDIEKKKTEAEQKKAEAAEKKRLADLAKNPPARGMGYGSGERRERWYPARV